MTLILAGWFLYLYLDEAKENNKYRETIFNLQCELADLKWKYRNDIK